MGKVGFSWEGASDLGAPNDPLSSSMQTISWGSAASTGSLTFGASPLPSINRGYWEATTRAASLVSEAGKTAWYETTTSSGTDTTTTFASSIETTGSVNGYTLSYHSEQTASGGIASVTNVSGILRIVPDGFTGYSSDLETTESASFGTITVEATFTSYNFAETQSIEAYESETFSYWGIGQTSQTITATTAILAPNGGAQIAGPWLVPLTAWVAGSDYGASDHAVVRLGSSYGSTIDNATPHTSSIHPRIADVVSFTDWTSTPIDHRFVGPTNFEVLTADASSRFTVQNIAVNLISSYSSSHATTYAGAGYSYPIQSGSLGGDVESFGGYFVGSVTTSAEEYSAGWHLRVTSYESSGTGSTTLAVSESSVLSAPESGWVYLQPDYFITANKSGLLL